jgi:predicted nucleic acid-binding protein
LYHRKAIVNIVVDTSVLIAVLVNELERSKIVNLTIGLDLLAPGSVHWEIGNALSAMIKRKAIRVHQVEAVLKAYRQIPIRLVDVDLDKALEIALDRNIYAYDAYIIECARENRCKVLSLDKGLVEAAIKAGVGVLEVPA